MTPYLTLPLPRAQDAPFSDARGDPTLIEEFEKRNGVFPGNAEQVLDIARTDLLALAQHRDELGLDRVERSGVEEERFLDTHELAGLHEDLEELVLLIAGDSGPAQRLFGARRGGLRPFEKGAKSLGADRHATREGRQAHAAGADMTDMLLQHDLRAPRLQQREMFDQGRTLALEARGVDVEQGPPADRHDRRVRAHDEPVAGSRDQRRFETEPREGRVTRRQFRPVDEERARHDLARADVEAHARAGLYGARRVRQELKRR